MKHKIGILGAGTWGMALARMLTVSGNDVQVWSAIEAEVDNLSTTRVHPNLPGMKIPEELQFTKSIEEVCTGKDVLLFAVPSVFVRSTTAKARPYIPDGQILVDVAKGMEPDTLYTMTEVIADELKAGIVDKARAQMAQTLQQDLDRLEALKAVNPNVRDSELDYLRNLQAELHHLIDQTQLKLDAIRFIVVTHN